MASLVKIGLVVAAVYAVTTAPEAERRTMFEGAKAFASAVAGACTREGSPCRLAMGIISNGASLLFDSSRSDTTKIQSDGTRRSLDDSPRQGVRRQDGV